MSLVTNPVHALTFGPLNFIGTQAEYLANGYTFEALGDDADWGNPVPIEVAVASWLQDGANVSVERYENRDLFIRVKVRGQDSDDLARAEEALVFQCGKPNLLTWTPPDGIGAPCVFEVATSTPEQIPDDLADLRREATYGLKVKAFPFVRAADETVISIPTPTGTQTITSVDDCTSFTNWAASYTVSVGSAAGPNNSGTAGGLVYAIGRNWTLNGNNARVTLTRTSLSASITTTPYIRIQATTAVSGGAQVGLPIFTFNGVDVPVAVQEGTTYWLDTTGLGLGSTLTSVVIRALFGATDRNNLASAELDVLDISRSNIIGTQATGRQLARTLTVLGSARTQGTISLADTSNALGDVLIHTMPAIAGLLQPNLRRALTSGNSQTSDPSLVSGFYSSLSALHTFDLAASGLLAGTYALMARVRHTSTGDRNITWVARSRMGSTNLSEAQTGVTTVSLVANTWKIVYIDDVTLPTVLVGPNGLVRIELTGVASMDIDEAWLFNLDDGNLTWVDCGTAAPSAGGSASRLFIDSPTPDAPTYQYYLGTAADRSDSFYALTIKSEGHHELVPSAVNVFTVTPNSTASVLGFRYFRRAWTRIKNL